MTRSYLDEYDNKTVLVTGGAGAIGSNLTRALAERGAKVIVMDDLSSAERWNVPSLPNVLFVEGDILDEIKLKRVFFERPRIVYHLAAFFANQNSVDHPEKDLAGNVLRGCRRSKPKGHIPEDSVVVVTIQGLDGGMLPAARCLYQLALALADDLRHLPVHKEGGGKRLGRSPGRSSRGRTRANARSGRLTLGEVAMMYASIRIRGGP